MFAIILISIMATLVVSLFFVVIKNVASPKKLESIPKLIKQGKTQNAIRLAKQIITKDPKNYKYSLIDIPELILDRMKKSKTNEAFLASMNAGTAGME